ncbi:MAG TPA: hypothetical protein VMU01_11245 [Rhizomicrobium sp.]|nr:hypothetical protein [Rhizomicrobium sp.]
MAIEIPVSAGTLIDLIVILRIKKARIRDAAKRDVVERELEALARVREAVPLLAEPPVLRLEAELVEANETLWEIEDELRTLEAKKDFGTRFVEQARRVYLTNDKRSALKKEIDRLAGSEFWEEKSFSRDNPG